MVNKISKLRRDILVALLNKFSDSPCIVFSSIDLGKLSGFYSIRLKSSVLKNAIECGSRSIFSGSLFATPIPLDFLLNSEQFLKIKPYIVVCRLKSDSNFYLLTGIDIARSLSLTVDRLDNLYASTSTSFFGLCNIPFFSNTHP